MTRDESPVVLIVDDEPDVVKVYELSLGDEYTVRTATNGRDVIAEELDETVDVVLLDRRMPELSGEEVLENIRDHGYDCRVAMVTAVEPDFDILEMQVDDYVTKPVDGGDLIETVEKLLALNSLDQIIRERFVLAQKRAALKAEKSAAELDGHEAYAELEHQLETLEARSDDIISEMDAEQFAAAMQNLPDADEG